MASFYSDAAPADVFHMPTGLVSLQFVNVGDAGNLSDGVTHLGGVTYAYRIGTFDITIAQYTDFLNAVAAADQSPARHTV